MIFQFFFKFHDFSIHGTYFCDFPGFPGIPVLVGTLSDGMKKSADGTKACKITQEANNDALFLAKVFSL